MHISDTYLVVLCNPHELGSTLNQHAHTHEPLKIIQTVNVPDSRNYRPDIAISTQPPWHWTIVFRCLDKSLT